MIKPRTMILLVLPTVSMASTFEPALTQQVTSPPPCAGLLCEITPNSMAKPITASEAAQMRAQSERDFNAKHADIAGQGNEATLPARNPRPMTCRAAVARLPARAVAAVSSRRPSKTVDTAAPVTIAADDAQMSRAPALASVISTPRIRIVRTDGLRPSPSADLRVDADLQPSGPSKRLFTERLVILAGAKIASTGDMAGRIVSFGPNGSSTQHAARALFRSIGITVRETPLEIGNALDGLSTSDIDAVVTLAPQGFKGFTGLDKSGVRLLSLPKNSMLPARMAMASVDPGEYPGLGKGSSPVEMATIDIVLRQGAKAKNGRAAKMVFSALSRHSTELAKRGFDLVGSIQTARSVAKDAQ